MAKLKTCSFCGKETSKLWYAKPPCCANWSCKQKYNEEKIVDKKTEFRNKASTQTSSKKPIKPIATYSAKRLKELAKYRILRDEYLKDKPYCEIQSPVCTGRTTELHHKKTRRHHLCDVSVFCASCRACNSYVESHHAWAEERGFKQRTSYGEQNKNS